MKRKRIFGDLRYGSYIWLKDGWISFKRFSEYDEALEYARQNFDEVVRLFEIGDCD